MQMRICPGPRDPHRPQENSGGRQEKAEADYRKVCEVAPPRRETNKRMSILVVGSVAFDDVTSPSGSVKNILGGAATYFSLAASYFTPVRVVAVVGEDFGADEENVFHRHGIDIRGLERAK